jgi:hypothetical protein
MRATAIHFQHGFAATIAADIAAHPDLACDYVHGMVAFCAQYSAGFTFAQGLEIEARLYQPVGALLERYDALIIPTSCAASLTAGDSYMSAAAEAGGAPVAAVGLRRPGRTHGRPDRGAHVRRRDRLPRRRGAGGGGPVEHAAPARSGPGMRRPA